MAISKKTIGGPGPKYLTPYEQQVLDAKKAQDAKLQLIAKLKENKDAAAAKDVESYGVAIIPNFNYTADFSTTMVTDDPPSPFLYKAFEVVTGYMPVKGDSISYLSATNTYVVMGNGGKYVVKAEKLGNVISKLAGNPLSSDGSDSGYGDGWGVYSPPGTPAGTYQTAGGGFVAYTGMINDSSYSSFIWGESATAAVSGKPTGAVKANVRREGEYHDDDEKGKKLKWPEFFKIARNLERAVVRFKGESYKESQDLKALRRSYTIDVDGQWWHDEYRMTPTGEQHMHRVKVSFADVPDWIREGKAGPTNPVQDNEILDPNPKLHKATGLSSKIRPQHNMPDMHKVVLDIDHPAVLIDTSTPGHHHLIIEKYMKWEEYKELLGALAKAGIIEEGYAGASIRRGATWIRAPWHKKGMEVKHEPESTQE